MTYTVIVLNESGASLQSGPVDSKEAVRRIIRNWYDPKRMTARVWNSDGECIYDGRALGFK